VATVEKKALIIGGGIAGMTAAWSLARLGAEPLIVEKSPFLGGHAIQFACKAAASCQQCAACEVDKRLREVVAEPAIGLRLGAELAGATKVNGNWRVKVSRRPPHIDPARCIDCGLCQEACPAGAIQAAWSAHSHPRFAIDAGVCLTLSRKSACKACIEACPAAAIDLKAQAELTEEAVGAIILASGFAPYDPTGKPQFGYGQLSNVLTALEVERALRQSGELRRPTDDQLPERVAFIQCVGSREKTRNFCSQVCCGYALRISEALRERQPATQVSVFYIDLQAVGRDFERFRGRCQQDLRLIRSIPGDIYPLPDGRLRIFFADPATHAMRDEEFDLAVLSVGIGPGADNQTLAGLLGVGLDEHGFFATPEGLDNTRTAREGVYLAGTSQGPRDVAGSIAHASRAAWEAAKHLGV